MKPGICDTGSSLGQGLSACLASSHTGVDILPVPGVENSESGPQNEDWFKNPEMIVGFF